MNNMLQPNVNMMGQFGGRPFPYYLTNKIIVNSIEEVKQYPVPPGGDYVFLHSTEPILFRKVVDNYNQYQITQFTITQTELNDGNQYVLLSEFNALKTELDTLKNKMEVTNEPVKQQQSIE